eukprot:CAMPEP_0184672552 /NCGR_PEP_ID=MMETSP0308-20130426/86159_1 /TAXON_ID=38269 /ORGANISM="Gloeochaete witrockiana, Strain SAG 46.84" /LENGTH=339 /DNA_ID=CAMNT_0027119893 /DNA_START=123 /DNA_END=1138 /DNA_ORIENTATION=+
MAMKSVPDARTARNSYLLSRGGDEAAFERIIAWFTSFSDEDYDYVVVPDEELDQLPMDPNDQLIKTPEEKARHMREYLEMRQVYRRKLEQEAREIAKLRRMQKIQERKRRQQNDLWLNQIVPSWEKRRHSAGVNMLWRQGLPPRVRGIVWPLAIGNSLQVTRDLFQIFGQHARNARREVMLSAQAEAEAHDALKMSEQTNTFGKPAFRVIGKEGTVRFIGMDLERTFPHLAASHEVGSFYDQLRQILESYVFYRPDVGYVQGMSYVAAMLLLYMDPLTAFTCFSNLLNQHYFLAFFKLDLNELRKHFKVYEMLFAEHMPHLYKRFQDLRILPELYCMEW